MHPLAQNLLGGFESELVKQAKSPRFMPGLNVKGVPASLEASQWKAYRQALAERPAVLESAAKRIQAAKERGTPMSFNVKGAAAPVQAAAQAALKAAPKAEGVAQKIVSVMRKRPVLTAATAAAAGAGAATGTAQAKAKAEEESRRREQVRQLLMARLSEGGYFG